MSFYKEANTTVRYVWIIDAPPVHNFCSFSGFTLAWMMSPKSGYDKNNIIPFQNDERKISRRYNLEKSDAFWIDPSASSEKDHA
jgi:hypothetical protein